jgi:hypothetical protein
MIWQGLGAVAISTFPIPHAYTDGFLSAYWRRPASYLDPRIRAGMSSSWVIGDVSAELARLKADLNNGKSAKRYVELLTREASDTGYRLVVTK